MTTRTCDVSTDNFKLEFALQAVTGISDTSSCNFLKCCTNRLIVFFTGTFRKSNTPHWREILNSLLSFSEKKNLYILIHNCQIWSAFTYSFFFKTRICIASKTKWSFPNRLIRWPIEGYFACCQTACLLINIDLKVLSIQISWFVCQALCFICCITFYLKTNYLLFVSFKCLSATLIFLIVSIGIFPRGSKGPSPPPRVWENWVPGQNSFGQSENHWRG